MNNLNSTKEHCKICLNEVNNTCYPFTAKGTQNNIDEFVYSNKPCSECESMLSKGFVLIGAVEAKTTNKNNPYRSGNIWCIKRDVASEIFDGNIPSIGFSFIDVNIAKEMNLPNVNLDA